MSKHALTIAMLCAALTGCGGSGDSTSMGTTAPATVASTTTTAPSPISVTVFRVQNGDLVAEVEHVRGTRSVAAASLAALGLTTPVSIANGTATVERDDATPTEVAEIVYTLTQYPSVRRVDVAGRTGLTRADIAEFVPPILIERPAAGAATGELIAVSGSASVFEATVMLELRQNGNVVQKKVVTAAEGAPGRGPFSGTLLAPAAGRYVVAAYSPSAVDGSPQHEQDVPVTVTP
jgi:hypothetical protein